MHKTANSLLHIDLADKILKFHNKFVKTEEASRDDVVCGIVELAYSKKFRVLKLDWNSKVLVVRSVMEKVDQRQITAFLSYAHCFLEDEFEYIFIGKCKIDYLAHKYGNSFSLIACSERNSDIILKQEQIDLEVI